MLKGHLFANLMLLAPLKIVERVLVECMSEKTLFDNPVDDYPSPTRGGSSRCGHTSSRHGVLYSASWGTVPGGDVLRSRWWRHLNCELVLKKKKLFIFWLDTTDGSRDARPHRDRQAGLTPQNLSRTDTALAH